MAKNSKQSRCAVVD